MKTADDLLRLVFDDVGNRAVEDFKDIYSRWSERCQSPIEAVMAAALLAEKPDGIDFFCKPGPEGVPIESILMGTWSFATDYIGAAYPQFIVGSYRADFYIEVYDKETKKRWYRAIVECDGHNFHEKNKHQVARDKQRDRWFQSQGIYVLRFTGSEIWSNPIHCAEQVYEHFNAAVIREYADLWGHRA